MGFDWKLFIQLVDEFITHKRKKQLEEAYLRTALSRSYYGVFGIAYNERKSRGIPLESHSKHLMVRNSYAYSSSKEEKQISSYLNRLWRLRVEADYKENAKITLDNVKIAQETARKAIEGIGKI